MAGAALKLVDDTPEKNSTLPVAEYGFEEAWLLYPKKQAKKDAMKAWSQMVTPADVVEVLTALAAWRRVWLARGDDQYTPLLASWLRGERWTDEVPAAFRNTPTAHVPVAGNPVAAPRGDIPEHVKALIARLKK